MTVHHEDPWLTIHGGDCREVLATLPDESINCIVTSPPYWGLRDYGTATWDGGDAGCDHKPPKDIHAAAVGPSKLGGGKSTQADAEASRSSFRARCGKCGATRQDRQLGLEPTPEEYVANMVAVFREARRVLRSDGTLWLNLGSSYLNGGPSGPQGKTGQRAGRTFTAEGLGSGAVGASGRSRSRRPERAPACGTDGTGPLGCSDPGCACSGLCDGCRDALTPRTTGTRRPRRGCASQPSQTARDTEPRGSVPGLPEPSRPDAQESTSPRSETPPPGPCSHCGNCGACLSVLRSTSRDSRACGRMSACTDGTGSRSGTSDAGRSDTEPSGLAWGDYTSTIKPKDLVPIPWMVAMALQADGWYLRSDLIWAKPNPMPESVTDRPTKAHEYLFLLTKSPRYWYDADAVREDGTGRTAGNVGPVKGAGNDDPFFRTREGFAKVADKPWTARNRRSVWTVATQPYPGAHFAVMPEALVEPCVLAGCPDQACATCGAPWERVVERATVMTRPGSASKLGVTESERRAQGRDTTVGLRQRPETTTTTTGWKPTCDHDAPTVPGTVLDPFGGSGTVARVANRLSRRAVLIDLNPEYLEQQMKRNADMPLGLTAA